MNLLTFFPWANRPTQSIKTPVSLTCHGASQEIRDFDAAIAYFFSAQAIFQADATRHEHYVPSLIIFPKFSKILTQTLSGKPPYTSCLVLARRKGATEVMGFFGSSLRAVADKKDLGAFRGKQLKEASWTNTAKCTFLELTSVWILCGVDTSAIEPSAVGSPFGLNLYRQSVDSHRQEGKLKFNSQINGFAIDNFKAK